MIAQSIEILNGKGGVGKTSLTAAVGALAAASGWKVLIVDLDPQGNMAREFGYSDISDLGDSLHKAVFLGQPLSVLEDIRPNLSIVPGGPQTSVMADQLLIESMRSPQSAYEKFGLVLERAAAPFDLVLFDCPPGQHTLHAMISSVAHYVLVPTIGDAASTDGLATVLAQITQSRAGVNPHLELLGVAVMFMPTTSKIVDREVRKDLADLLGPGVHIFKPSIRHAHKAAIDTRARGIQALEYEALKITSDKAHPWYEALRTGKKAPRFSSAASGLASDYQKITEQVLAAFTQRQTELGC
jgi:chromosome partitioning protein